MGGRRAGGIGDVEDVLRELKVGILEKLWFTHNGGVTSFSSSQEVKVTALQSWEDAESLLLNRGREGADQMKEQIKLRFLQMKCWTGVADASS